MLAKKNGLVVIFDIDYRPYTWKNNDEVSIYYSLVARNSDILLGSRSEYDLMESVTGTCPDDRASAALWHSYGNKIVIIKHGKEGSMAYLDDGRSFKVKPFPVQMLKGFGGGDGYASAFIFSLLKGKSIEDALEFATASASMLVSAHSCSAAMPVEDEVEAFIKEGKEKAGSVVEEQ
jgi:5-dehydro-2-deoxygluconokinase